MVAPTYAYTTASDTFTYSGGTAVANVYNPDVTAIGTYKDLWRRPNSAAFGYGQRTGTSDCQWLWNNPLAVQSKWFDPNNAYSCPPGGPPYLGGSITDLTPYTPVNAIDSASPWDRVLITNPDYDCNTCVCAGCGGTSATNPRQHYRCGNFVYYSAGVLYIAESTAPAGSPPIFAGSITGGGYWYWVFEFRAQATCSWSYNRTSPPGASEIHDASSPAGTYGIDVVNVEPAFGGHVVGGRALNNGDQQQAVWIRYVKEIDCDTDFEGTAVTLPFDRISTSPAGRIFTMTTYPASVSIELTP